MVATEHILPGSPEIRITLRRNARAKRISLRVSRLDGRVTLTVPRGVPESEALNFARSKQDWLGKQLHDRPAEVFVDFGTELPLQGELLLVTQGAGRRCSTDAGQLRVPASKALPAKHVEAFLKNHARQTLSAAVEDYAQKLGRPYGRMTLRDTRSRWGSCSSEGNLMFSWRLIMAPREVLQYVAAHEVAHLAQMNHSPAFWAVVERIYGPHNAERTWLRQHGEKLHRYRFTTPADSN